jgi:hypothetical protein
MNTMTVINKSMGSLFLQYYIPSFIKTKTKLLMLMVEYLKKYNAETYNMIYDTNNWSYQQALYTQ